MSYTTRNIASCVALITLLTSCAAMRASRAGHAAENELISNYAFTQDETELRESIIDFLGSEGFEVNRESSVGIKASKNYEDGGYKRVTATVISAHGDTATHVNFVQTTRTVTVRKDKRGRAQSTSSTNTGTDDALKKRFILFQDPEFKIQVEEAVEAAKIRSRLED